MIWWGLANSNPIHNYKVLTAIRFRLSDSLLDIIPTATIKSSDSLLAWISIGEQNLDLFPNTAWDLLPLIEASCICCRFPICILFRCSNILAQNVEELQQSRITRSPHKRLTNLRQSVSSRPMKSLPQNINLSHWSGPIFIISTNEKPTSEY